VPPRSAKLSALPGDGAAEVVARLEQRHTLATLGETAGDH
jgi:hypothetical protein